MVLNFFLHLQKAKHCSFCSLILTSAPFEVISEGNQENLSKVHSVQSMYMYVGVCVCACVYIYTSSLFHVGVGI